MCKKAIVKSYISQKEFRNIYYFGDGKNDFCPVKFLLENENSIAFVRSGLALEKSIRNWAKENKEKLEK